MYFQYGSDSLTYGLSESIEKTAWDLSIITVKYFARLKALDEC